MSKLQACPHCFQPVDVADETCPLCQEPLGKPSLEKQWRIPCPNGHVFRAPDSWMGRQMVCPMCNEPFVLKLTDSLEKIEERRLRQDEADAKLAKAWLARSIWALIIVIGFIASLVIFSQAR
jgi:RNA polymerase subunit RPABC4/transcription elongation factor Spt4